MVGAVEAQFDRAAAQAGKKQSGHDIWYLANETWDPRDPVRIVNLANRCPDLLTADEEFVWVVIKEDERFQGDGPYGISEQAVSEHWDTIQGQALDYREKFGPRN